MILHQTLPNATISQTGNITCNDIACTSLIIHSIPYIPYTEIIALNNVAATANVQGTGGAVPGWTYSHTGSGGFLKVTAYITCYVASSTTPVKSWYIYKGPFQKAQGTFYWKTTQVNQHTTMPAIMFIDPTRLTVPATWTVRLDAGVYVDSNDRCTMTIAEFQ